MIILFILGLLLGGLMVVFALQNITAVTVSFFSWQLEGSLALILALAAITGVIVTLLLILPESVSNYFKFKSLQRENKKLEEDLRKQKELTEFAKIPPTSPEIIAHIEESERIDSHLL